MPKSQYKWFERYFGNPKTFPICWLLHQIVGWWLCGCFKESVKEKRVLAGDSHWPLMAASIIIWDRVILNTCFLSWLGGYFSNQDKHWTKLRWGRIYLWNQQLHSRAPFLLLVCIKCMINSFHLSGQLYQLHSWYLEIKFSLMCLWLGIFTPSMSNELYLVFFYEILGAASSTQEFSFKKSGMDKSEKKLDRAHTL